MADVGDRLRIKFGLRDNPTVERQKFWAEVTERLVTQGYTRDQAGRMAAQQVFADFNSMVYASEGDSIEMLLQRIRDK